MDRKLIMLKSPNLILAGFGALAKMGEEAGTLEAKKALLVTDKGITASGITAKVEKVLTDQKIAVDIFDQVIPDPDIACCEKCIDAAKASNLVLHTDWSRWPWPYRCTSRSRQCRDRG